MSGRVLGWALVAVSMVAVTGCEDNEKKEAIAALQVLADEQTRQIEGQNEDIVNAIKGFEACVGKVTALEGDEMILDAKRERFEAPVLAGEPTIEGLEKLRMALDETLELQKIELGKIKKSTSDCNEQLAAATKAKEEADAIEAKKAAKRKRRRK